MFGYNTASFLCSLLQSPFIFKNWANIRRGRGEWTRRLKTDKVRVKTGKRHSELASECPHSTRAGSEPFCEYNRFGQASRPTRMHLGNLHLQLCRWLRGLYCWNDNCLQCVSWLNEWWNDEISPNFRTTLLSFCINFAQEPAETRWSKGNTDPGNDHPISTHTSISSPRTQIYRAIWKREYSNIAFLFSRTKKNILTYTLLMHCWHFLRNSE